MPNTSTPRAIGIVRVSRFHEDTAHSPEAQVRALLALAERRGWSLAPEDIRDENDIANGNVSGSADLSDRPGLGPAVEAIERHEAQVICAENFDRFFRDLDVQREVIRRVEAAGGRMETVGGEISHVTATGELRANIEGSVAQYVRRSAMERSRAAVAIAIEQGKIPWHRIAPGYIRGEDGKLTPDPAVAPAILAAFKLRASGKTVATVRAYLAEHGVSRSYHGTGHILRDHVYRGEIHFGTYAPNLKAHKAIIDEDLFERVQAISLPRGRRAQSERLLARLEVLRCSGCGGRMVVGTQTRRNGDRYTFYRCGAVRADCGARQTIGADIVEGVVAEALREALANVEGRASVEENTRRADEAADAAQRQLDAAVRVLADFTDASAVARLAELRQTRDATLAEQERLRGQSAVLTISAAADWDRLTLSEHRALISAVVDRVTVGPVAEVGRGAGRVEVLFK
jgi:DNA invertase Pin-like site-specific DNA recombinase